MKNFELKDPERPLGTVKWPEFTRSVEEQNQSMLTRTYTALYHLNRQHELKHNPEREPRRRGPISSLATPKPAASPEPTDLVFLNNAEWYNPTDDLEIDLDYLYILARTGKLDQARGLGEKTLTLVTGLINQQIDAQTQTPA